MKPNVAPKELREEKQVGGPVNCSDSELSIYLLGLEAGYLPTYYSDTNQSVQSKSMSIVSKSYQRGKKTVVFHGFPSLQMSRSSTDDLGAELLMWFREVSLARTSVPQEREQELKGRKADCGWKWPGSLAKYDPVMRLWRTRQCSLLADSESYSETWPRWGLMRDGELLMLPPLVPPTLESESGLWPTPNVPNGGRRVPNTAEIGGDLTLTAYVNGEKCQVGLEQAVKWYPTPTAVTNTGGAALCKWGGSGARAKLRTMVTPQELNGALNPEWVEKLMGWPDDWTSLQPISHVKMCFWLMGMHNGTESGRSEVMRMLREGDAAQEIQRAIGRPVGIHEAALLLAELCEHANRPDKARVFMACAEALEEEVRGVRLCEGTTGAPHRPGQQQQRAGEHPDAMQALSRLLAHHGQAYWQDGRWEDATARVADGVAARVDRLKAIGNGQVPQCAAEAWRILTHNVAIEPRR